MAFKGSLRKGNPMKNVLSSGERGTTAGISTSKQSPVFCYLSDSQTVDVMVSLFLCVF